MPSSDDIDRGTDAAYDRWAEAQPELGLFAAAPAPAKKQSLDAQVLAYLQTGAVLTPAVGEERWKCLAVHSSVARLRAVGHKIDCKMIYPPSGRRYGEYTLVVEPKA